MATFVLNAAAPTSTVLLKAGSLALDTLGLTQFTTAIGAQRSRWIDVSNCLSLTVRIITAADSTATVQWEVSDNPLDLANFPAILAPGITLCTNPKLDGSTANQGPVSITGRHNWLSLNLLTNTGGGPIRGLVSGWALDKPEY